MPSRVVRTNSTPKVVECRNLPPWLVLHSSASERTSAFVSNVISAWINHSIHKPWERKANFNFKNLTNLTLYSVIYHYYYHCHWQNNLHRRFYQVCPFRRELQYTAFGFSQCEFFFVLHSAVFSSTCKNKGVEPGPVLISLSVTPWPNYTVISVFHLRDISMPAV
jgi:hypothetical protein